MFEAITEYRTSIHRLPNVSSELISFPCHLKLWPMKSIADLERRCNASENINILLESVVMHNQGVTIAGANIGEFDHLQM